MNWKDYTYEELIAMKTIYSVTVDGRCWVSGSLLGEIGRREAQMANRQPGDPGTIQNPIMKNGNAYAYNSRKRVSLIEDYVER